MIIRMPEAPAMVNKIGIRRAHDDVWEKWEEESTRLSIFRMSLPTTQRTNGFVGYNRLHVGLVYGGLRLRSLRVTSLVLMNISSAAKRSLLILRRGDS